MHRDIKPANVLISEPGPGQGGRPRDRAAGRGDDRRRYGHDRRHPAVHGARAGERAAGHARHRRVQRRHRAVRDARRAPAVRRRVGGRDRAAPRAGACRRCRAGRRGRSSGSCDARWPRTPPTGIRARRRWPTTLARARASPTERKRTDRGAERGPLGAPTEVGARRPKSSRGTRGRSRARPGRPDPARAALHAAPEREPGRAPAHGRRTSCLRSRVLAGAGARRRSALTAPPDRGAPAAPRADRAAGRRRSSATCTCAPNSRHEYNRGEARHRVRPDPGRRARRSSEGRRSRSRSARARGRSRSRR